MKIVITSYRLGEMSGGFGETGSMLTVVIFLICSSLPPSSPHKPHVDHAASPMVIKQNVGLRRNGGQSRKSDFLDQLYVSA